MNLIKPPPPYNWSKSTLQSYNTSINPHTFTPNPINARIPYRNQDDAPYRYFQQYNQYRAIPGGSVITPSREGLLYYQNQIPRDLETYYKGLEIPLATPQSRYIKAVANTYPSLNTGEIRTSLNLYQ